MGAHFALAEPLQALDLAYRCGMRAEDVAPMDQHHILGEVGEVHDPVEGGITAAHHQHAAARESLGIEHGIVEPFSFPPSQAVGRELARGKGSDAGRNQQGPGGVHVLFGLEQKMPDPALGGLDFLEPGDHFAELDLAAELQRLLRHSLDEVPRENPGEARHVEDEFLGIEREQLPAQGPKRIDDTTRGPPHSGIECAEEAGGAAADDRDVGECVRHLRNIVGRTGGREVGRLK